MPGNHVGPLRHLPTLIHPLLHLNIPTHTITTGKSQVRSFIHVRNIPEEVANGIRWRSMTRLLVSRAFGEPCRCLG